MAARAGEAFTHAFNVTSLVAAVVALAAAGAVAVVFGRKVEDEAAASGDLAHAEAERIRTGV